MKPEISLKKMKSRYNAEEYVFKNTLDLFFLSFFAERNEKCNES